MINNIDYTVIGRNIKKYRNKKNITQEKLAEYCDISTTHISNIENGNTKVGLPTLVNIANILGCTLDDLVDINIHNYKPILNNQLSNLINTNNPKELHLYLEILSVINDYLKENDEQ